MEYSKSLVEKIFFEYIIPNTKNGSIELTDSETEEKRIFNITLTIDEPSNEFNLNIINRDRFVSLLYEYVKVSMLSRSNNFKNITDEITNILTLIWCNATIEDLNNPEKFLQKQTDFENNKLFENNIFSQDIPLLFNSDIVIDIKKQDFNYETPYLFCTTIKNDDSEYYLPSISYGISNDCCYIYAIQNKKTFSNDLNFEKKIKRQLYKLNDGVTEGDEYTEYKNGNTYYPENISDISPSTLISLTCFFKLLYEHNITKVKVVSYLPIRYKNKEDYYQKLYDYKSKTVENKLELLNTLKEEHQKIQENLTEKLIRNFRRMNFHFPNIDIVSFPMELDEYMHINIGEFPSSNNSILTSIIDKHENKEKGLI